MMDRKNPAVVLQSDLFKTRCMPVSRCVRSQRAHGYAAVRVSVMGQRTADSKRTPRRWRTQTNHPAAGPDRRGHRPADELVLDGSIGLAALAGIAPVTWVHLPNSVAHVAWGVPAHVPWRRYTGGTPRATLLQQSARRTLRQSGRCVPVTFTILSVGQGAR